MSDFVNWTTEYTKMLNDWANRDHLVHSYRTPDGTFVQYKDDKSFFDALGMVKAMADDESASAGQATRRAYCTIQGDW